MPDLSKIQYKVSSAGDYQYVAAYHPDHMSGMRPHPMQKIVVPPEGLMIFNMIGYACIKDNMVILLQVHKDWHRMGVATNMYHAVEAVNGKPLTPNPHRSTAAGLFRNSFVSREK